MLMHCELTLKALPPDFTDWLVESRLAQESVGTDLLVALLTSGLAWNQSRRQVGVVSVSYARRESLMLDCFSHDGP